MNACWVKRNRSIAGGAMPYSPGPPGANPRRMSLPPNSSNAVTSQGPAARGAVLQPPASAYDMESIAYLILSGKYIGYYRATMPKDGWPGKKCGKSNRIAIATPRITNSSRVAVFALTWSGHVSLRAAREPSRVSA